MKSSKQVFLDIDTQVDFMHPEGKLYVPGAECIEPQLKKLLAYAKQAHIPILASVDAHLENDPEFQQFPAHCIKGTPGQQKITATYLSEARIVGVQVQHLEMLKYQHLVFEKTVFDIFSNPNTEEALKQYQTEEVVVFGVATDYCVKAAVLGLKQRGYDVIVVSDAIKAVSDEGHQETMQIFDQMNISLKKTAEIIGEEE